MHNRARRRLFSIALGRFGVNSLAASFQPAALGSATADSFG
jgi:hypothetical protein